MKVSVIVPTYSRADDLNLCLQALSQQAFPPFEIIVVCRPQDAATLQIIQHWSPSLRALRAVFVERSGQVAALNAGLGAAQGDIVAFTDDDARPWPDWTFQIEAHFRADPQVGGVGGRDWLYREGILEDGAKTDIGRLTWFGRAIGHHHLGVGGPQEVQFLKGANMSFRRAAVADYRFDSRLRGSGAQCCNDMAYGLGLRRRGWKLLYDPAVCVDHHPAPRFDNDQRSGFDFTAAVNRVHNETLAVIEHLPPWKRLSFLVWAALIGSKISPGIAILPIVARTQAGSPFRWLWACWCGRLWGLRSWISSRPQA